MNALLIDGLNMIRRVFAGVPEAQSEEGHVDAVLRSMRASVNRAIRRHSPSHAVCVNESDIPGWRHDLFPEYKLNRSPMPERLHNNLGKIADEMSAMGIGTIKADGYEADDVIATLATGIADRGGRAIILSTDNMFCQLLREGIVVYDHFQGRVMDYDYVVDKFGVAPDMLRDFFALTGVSSLNISGASGIGPKTANQLLNHYGGLSELLEAVEQGTEQLPPKLLAGKKAVLLARELVGVRTDVKLGVNLKDLCFTRRRYIP